MWSREEEEEGGREAGREKEMGDISKEEAGF